MVVAVVVVVVVVLLGDGEAHTVILHVEFGVETTTETKKIVQRDPNTDYQKHLSTRLWGLLWGLVLRW